MVLAYPDICFAVDGSHAGFDQLVSFISPAGIAGNARHIYVPILHATHRFSINIKDNQTMLCAILAWLSCLHEATEGLKICTSCGFHMLHHATISSGELYRSRLASHSLPLQILRDPGSRLHVQLVAYQGVGLHASVPETQSLATSQAYDCAQAEPVELLSGFVSYEQMGDAMGSSTRTIKFLQRQEEAILSLRGPGEKLRAFGGIDFLLDYASQIPFYT